MARIRWVGVIPVFVGGFVWWVMGVFVRNPSVMFWSFIIRWIGFVKFSLWCWFGLFSWVNWRGNTASPSWFKIPW